MIGNANINIDKEDVQILAKNIKAARLAKKAKNSSWTQGKVAQLAGIAQQSYADIENGDTKNPRYSVLVKIADVLETTLDFLVGRTSQKQAIAVYSETMPIEIPNAVGLIPVLTPEQAASNFEQEEYSLNEFKFVPVYSQEEVNYKAMLITSDSMHNSDPGGISFLKGSIVLYNPTQKPKNGDFVTVKLDPSHKELVVRQFIDEGVATGFKAFNSPKPWVDFSDKTELKGVIKRCTLDF